MLLHIVARGKIARSPEAELVDRYMSRIAWDTKLTELPDTGGKIPPTKDPHRTVALDTQGPGGQGEAVEAEQLPTVVVATQRSRTQVVERRWQLVGIGVRERNGA